jgi:hypothetical protein
MGLRITPALFAYLGGGEMVGLSPDPPVSTQWKGLIAAMPLENGRMIAQFYGGTPHAQALDKVAQMRRDLNHIQNALHGVERRIRANAPGDQMVSEFTLLYNWSVSLMESLFALTWAAYDKDRAEKVIRDFGSKFKDFTSMRTMVLTGRR